MVRSCEKESTVSERERFTPEEWRTLQFAPYWMFSAVVGAYSRFDPMEYQAFVRCLEAAAATQGQLIRELLASVLADRERLTEAYRADRRTIAVGLFEVSAVLDRAAPEEAMGFKGMLVSAIGEGVARARGRFGAQMSEEDADAVTLAAQLLSYDLDASHHPAP
jgi:hypothetical protein